MKRPPAGKYLRCQKYQDFAKIYTSISTYEEVFSPVLHSVSEQTIINNQTTFQTSNNGFALGVIYCLVNI